MTDLIERLRAIAETNGWISSGTPRQFYRDVADEIERLTAENKELRFQIEFCSGSCRLPEHTQRAQALTEIDADSIDADVVRLKREVADLEDKLDSCQAHHEAHHLDCEISGWAASCEHDWFIPKDTYNIKWGKYRMCRKCKEIGCPEETDRES